MDDIFNSFYVYERTIKDMFRKVSLPFINRANDQLKGFIKLTLCKNRVQQLTRVSEALSNLRYIIDSNINHA